MSVPVLSRLLRARRRQPARESRRQAAAVHRGARRGPTRPARRPRVGSDGGEPASPHCAPPPSGGSPTGPALRANPSPEVTDPVCRLPLPTLFYRLEAAHLGDLLRLSVRPGARAQSPALPRIFTGRRERTGRHLKCGAMPDVGTLSPDNPIPGERSVEKKRQLFPGLPPTSPSSVALPPPAVAASALRFENVNPIPFRGPAPRHPLRRTGGGRVPCRAARGDCPFPQDRLTRVQLLFTRNPSPLQSSRSSLEYLLLPPRSAPRAAPPALAPPAAPHWTPPRRETRRRRGPPRPPTARGLPRSLRASGNLARRFSAIHFQG